MARRFRSRPSEILHIEDGYEAYCFDEACCWMLGQLEEGKRPFFGRTGGTKQGSGNAETVSLLKQLGAEVKGIGN